ncbi:uncharacterized protein LOC118436299 [Folsomia candida]|uniref:uncharacterized protein LOC118436299 n=1 Tax=Folsomia candida TaxID=158441 RepID=UPI0016052C1F|nr:uncharacterized protein LOC118436299 [Folsomia candida]
MEKAERTDDDDQFQPETGRGRQTLLVSSVSSPLFYTVSGPEKVGSKKYYVEQLGCPSIIKPSFRDLGPGCTRLSAVGFPSTSYRQFPLDKLNKTIMGKSPPAAATTATGSKRFSVNRGDKFMSHPVKVNAKIRHIYSHITSTMSESSTNSHQSTVSTHTQTDLQTATSTDFENEDDNDVPQILSVDEETFVDAELMSRDAFTCMTPPPTPNNSVQLFPDEMLTHSVPPAYAGKLADLEKITGHIVIQRFFTRADEAFGMWLEKQLGMNVKSVGVGEEVVYDSSSPADAVHPNMDKYETSRISSAKKLRESRILEKIIEVDDILAGEEVVHHSEGVPLLDLAESNLDPEVAECSIEDSVRCECFADEFSEKCIEQVEEEGHEQVSLISGKTITNSKELTNIEEEEIISQCIAVEIIRGKLKDEQLETELRLGGRQDSLDDIITQHSVVDNNNFDKNEISSTTNDRPCIPDVIDVSQFYNTNSSNSVPQQLSQCETETNEDSEDLKTVISNPSMTESQLESQHKVAEYLGKLEMSSPTIHDASTSANSINSELDKDDNLDGEDLTSSDVIKRSVSVDSCIGTESSGERTAFNDSGILLDSARLDMDIPEEIEVIFVADHNNDKIASSEGLEDVHSQETVQETLEPEEVSPASVVAVSKLTSSSAVVLSNSQSVDDSTNYSRSDGSSALKHTISDEGGDADQSESNSDSEFNSLRKPLEDTATELDDPISAVMVDDDDDDGEGSAQDLELDQFDTIIENHEKEKRLRPIFRKRNVSTQTSKSVESSTVSCTTESRSTTATTTASSASSFDLEFISKTKKYISHIPSSSKHQHEQSSETYATTAAAAASAGGEDVELGRKHRSYLPTGSSGLNILNMRFTMGREFESEVSIRIPHQNPPPAPSRLPRPSTTFKTSPTPSFPPPPLPARLTNLAINSTPLILRPHHSYQSLGQVHIA